MVRVFMLGLVILLSLGAGGCKSFEAGMLRMDAALKENGRRIAESLRAANPNAIALDEEGFPTGPGGYRPKCRCKCPHHH